MANATIHPHSQLRWQHVMIAFGLSAGLLMVAALFGSFVPHPALIVVLAACAFAGAGLLTLRIKSAARPAEPALGAALLVLVLTIAQLAIGREAMPPISIGQLVLSVLLSLAFAAALAWMGARIAIRGTMAGPHQDAPTRL